MARLLAQPGFRELPDGFTVSEVPIDRDHWTEGFGVQHPAPEVNVTLRGVVCAFCGTGIPPGGDDPVELFVRSATSDAEQGLYAHAACLRRVVRPNVPLLAGLPDGDDVG